MNRIQELFSKNREKLIVYLTAGYPELNSTKDLVLSAIDSGADMIELGMPFPPISLFPFGSGALPFSLGDPSSPQPSIQLQPALFVCS